MLRVYVLIINNTQLLFYEMRYNKSSMSLIRKKAGLAVVQSKGNTSMYVLFQVKA